jgi:microcystin-dependent protein
MADQFVAEIRVFGFNFAPVGWAQCNGQLLPISQNTAVFSLLGTYYGGDGVSTFGLPNLQGAMAISQGTGPGLSQRVIGETGGESAVTLFLSELPAHNHSVLVSATSNEASPAGAVFGGAERGHSPAYGAAGTGVVNMNNGAVGTNGGGQPHDNMSPYQVLNFCIALQGIFPSRS